MHAGEGGNPDEVCTTDAPDASGIAYCPFPFFLSSVDTLVITQTSAAPLLLIDPTLKNVDPDPACDPNCPERTVIFDDPYALAPAAVDDQGSATAGEASDLDLVDNDYLHDQPITKLEVATPPAHGTVEVVDAATGAVRYTPAEGYAGNDTFTYTVTTAAGNATATVTIVVAAAPTESPSPTPTPEPTSDPTSSSDPTTGASGSGGDGGGSTALAATGASAGMGPTAVSGGLLTLGGWALLWSIGRRRGRRA